MREGYETNIQIEAEDKFFDAPEEPISLASEEEAEARAAAERTLVASANQKLWCLDIAEVNSSPIDVLSAEFYKTYSYRASSKSGIRLFEVNPKIVETFLAIQFKAMKNKIENLDEYDERHLASNLYESVKKPYKDFYEQFHQYLEGNDLLSEYRKIPKFLSAENDLDVLEKIRKLNAYIKEVTKDNSRAEDAEAEARKVAQTKAAAAKAKVTAAQAEAPTFEQKIVAPIIITALKVGICIALGISLANIIASTCICIAMALIAKKAYKEYKETIEEDKREAHLSATTLLELKVSPQSLGA